MVGQTGSSVRLRKFTTEQLECQNSFRGGVPVVCEVLSRRAVGGIWQSSAIATNCRLTEHCIANGLAFVDNWDISYSQDHFLMDGVHLSQRGIQILSESLEREMSALQAFFK